MRNDHHWATIYRMYGYVSPELWLSYQSQHPAAGDLQLEADDTCTPAKSDQASQTLSGVVGFSLLLLSILGLITNSGQISAARSQHAQYITIELGTLTRWQF